MQVKIPEPCSENWDLMTPKEKGRHCDKCDKVVTDFRKMDNYQIIDHLNNNLDACGRFYDFQLDKELKLPTLSNPWTSWMKKIALGGAFLGGVSNMKAQGRAYLHDSITCNTPIDSSESTSLATFESKTIKGKITQTDSKEHKLHSIKFTMDTFSIVILAGEKETNYSFNPPSNLKWDTIKAELATASDTVYLDIPRSSHETRSLADIDFIYRESWEYISLNNFILTGMSLPITSYGGVWEPDPIPVFWETFKFDTFKFILDTTYCTVGMIQSLPEDSEIINQSRLLLPQLDTSVLKDTLKQSKEQFKDYLIYQKRSKSIWWWLVPGILIFIIGAYQWKKKRNQNS